MSVRHTAIGAVISALYQSGGHRLFRRRFGGIGSILMFHRVRPPAAAGFAPNAFLEITPDFFEAIIHLLLDRGIDIVTLSEAHRRLTEGDVRRRFACLTFDDGFRDNYDVAFPICRRNGVPMVVYVATGLVDRRCSPWGLMAERVVAERDSVEFGGGRHSCASDDDKVRTFATLLAHGQALPRAGREALAAGFGLDSAELADAHLMTWPMIREMADSGCVELGGHTVHHDALATLDEADARAEIAEGCRRLAEMTGRPVRHFAYPFGGRGQAGAREFALCRELGLTSAVTTRHGNVMPAHRAFPHALPRLSINGLHQRRAAVEVFLSGATAGLQNGLRPVVTL